MGRATGLCMLLSASLIFNTTKSETPFFNTERSESGDCNPMKKITASPANSADCIQNDPNFGQFPIYYLKNAGQVTDENGNPVKDVLYLVKQKNMTIYIRENGLSYVQEFLEIDNTIDDLDNTDSYSAVAAKITGHRTDLDFVGSMKPKRIVERKSHNYSERYYLSKNKVLSTAYGFESLVLENVYSNIDLILYISEGKLKYDWYVKAGANHEQIKVKIRGSNSQFINAAGELVIETTLGSITETAPETFQAGVMLKSGYTLNGSELGFSIESFNPQLDLIIDPTREWATFHGGSSGDFGSDVVVGSDGNIYTYGHTFSSDFPSTTGAYQTVGAGKIDLTITKLSSAGIPVWATYF